MEIGIHEEAQPQDRELIRELGVTWSKFGHDVLNGNDEQLDRWLDWNGEAGLRTAVDLRTDNSAIFSRCIGAWEKLKERGQIETCAEDVSEADRVGIIQRNQERTSIAALTEIADLAAGIVSKYGDRCQDWEIWGEAQCPYVSGGVFGDRYQVYSGLLELCYKQIKAVDPSARVWSSGNGMDLDPTFIFAILDDKRGEFFDVANWHPYFMACRSFEASGTIMRSSFERTRRELQERGKDQPYAATEWGYPCYNVETAPVEELLKSHVVSDGIRQLYWSEQAQWYERDLQMMQEFGFEVVIVHCLRDTYNPDDPADRHWGKFCGLLDVKGERKQIWDVVQKWAWEGRAGKRAFE